MPNPFTDTIPEFVLKIEEDKFSGWISVDVSRSLEEFAHQFNITYVDKWTASNELWQIFSGDGCELLYDGKTLVTGHITNTDHDITGNTYTLTATGRSCTADLLDCSALFGKGIWRNKTLIDIVEAVCLPFEIDVDDRAQANRKFKRFEIDEGETAHDLINRACSIRACLPITTPAGQLAIMRANSNTPSDRLISTLAAGSLDMNSVISRRRSHNEQDRHSEYAFKGQTKADDEFFGYNAATKKGSARDTAIERYRPLIIMSETAGSKEDLGERAVWERNVRIARSERLSYTVDGILNTDGELWEPGHKIRVKDDIFKVDSTLLIVSVSNSFSAAQFNTTLELANEEAFTLLELPERGNAWNA